MTTAVAEGGETEQKPPPKRKRVPAAAARKKRATTVQPTLAEGDTGGEVATSKRKKKKGSAASDVADTAATTKRTKKTQNKSTTSSSRSKGAKAITTTGSAATATTSSSSPLILPPAHVLIVDNGGDTIKYGWQQQTFAPTTKPHVMPNVTARLPLQWTVLVGDQLAQIQNPNQLIGVTRSTERGIICNLGNQVQVWKRMLDTLGVVIPAHILAHSETAKALGWKKVTTSTTTAAAPNDKKKISSHPAHTAPSILSTTCAVLIALPPLCPRSILDQIMMIWMEDFGFGRVGFCTSTLVAAYETEDADFQTACTVDLGWSATHIVPTFQRKVLPATLQTNGEDKVEDQSQNHDTFTLSTIKRLPLAGRHLINMWKYFASYRQYNLMDQEWILRDVLEQTGYVSLQFSHEMSMARKLPPGRRPFDRQYILPDYTTTFTGRVQIPPQLLKQQQDKEIQEVEEKLLAMEAFSESKRAGSR